MSSVSAAVAYDYEEEGCTCSASPHPPCGWCENAPDPDSEEGLRRELRRVEADRDVYRREVKRLHARLAERVETATAAAKLQAQAKLIDARMSRDQGFALGCLAAALACVGALAAERSPRIEGSRFSWMEVD